MSKKPLSDEERDQLGKLEVQPEEQIDTADLPEAPGASWNDARRGDSVHPTKEPGPSR